MKVIFIHIPKTAGYAITMSLWGLHALQAGYGFTHKTVRELIHEGGAIREGGIPIMAVVRNPYDRLYSIFEFHRRRGHTRGSRKLRRLSFEDFILGFENGEEWARTEGAAGHGRTGSGMSAICRSCFQFVIGLDKNIALTDVLKFENLQCDYVSFCTKYKIKNTLVVQNVNPSKKVPDNLEELYSDEMRGVVERVFAEDLEHFNYSYGSFLETGIKKRPD